MSHPVDEENSGDLDRLGSMKFDSKHESTTLQSNESIQRLFQDKRLNKIDENALLDETLANKQKTREDLKKRLRDKRNARTPEERELLRRSQQMSDFMQGKAIDMSGLVKQAANSAEFAKLYGKQNSEKLKSNIEMSEEKVKSEARKKRKKAKKRATAALRKLSAGNG